MQHKEKRYVTPTLELLFVCSKIGIWNGAGCDPGGTFSSFVRFRGQVSASSGTSSASGYDLLWTYGQRLGVVLRFQSVLFHIPVFGHTSSSNTNSCVLSDPKIYQNIVMSFFGIQSVSFSMVIFNECEPLFFNLKKTLWNCICIFMY